MSFSTSNEQIDEEVDLELRILILNHIETIITTIITQLNDADGYWRTEAYNLYDSAQTQAVFNFVEQGVNVMRTFYRTTQGHQQVANLFASMLTIQDQIIIDFP